MSRFGLALRVTFWSDPHASRSSKEGSIVSDDNLIVRITVVGHASQRWRNAGSAAEADSLNQQLSEFRADNVRRLVEDIVRRELPGFKIEVPGRGAGSREGFPVASENNAAINRSVVVSIDLTTTQPQSNTQSRPIRLYAPSKFWRLQVLEYVGGSLFGGRNAHIRISIENIWTGRELIMSGFVYGGSFDPDPKHVFNPDVDVKTRPTDLLKPFSKKIALETDNAEDFSYWTGSSNSQMVRVVHDQVGVVRKVSTTFLQFTGLHTYSPGSLVFEWKKGWTLGTLNISVATGSLQVEGDVPSDYVGSTRMVTIDSVSRHNNFDALVVSFPTGKSSLHDLTVDDQKRLTDFATNKSRAIAAIAQSGFGVSNATP